MTSYGYCRYCGLDDHFETECGPQDECPSDINDTQNAEEDTNIRRLENETINETLDE